MTAGIRVLGPLEAEVDGARADLGGPLQRAVLALLLMERGRVVSVDRMIDQLWRGEPPPRAIASLQAYVSNLRRILEPGRARRAPARILVSAPPGYAVRLPDEAVDAWRFESLLTAARKAAPGQPERARHDLEQALALWHGPAYAEFADEEWAAAEVARLIEQHLAAQEAWAEIALRTGAAAEAVPAAEALIRQQPLREGSWRLLAHSLWACDRQADALAALRRARRTLRDELGLEPGPALAEVEEAILGQRQEVVRRAQPPPASAASRASRASRASQASQAEEPARAQDDLFVGRGDELRAIAAAATQHTGGVMLITGEGGAGKSRLLDRAAGQLAETGWTVVTGTMIVNYEREPERRAAFAAELGQVGHEHGLPEYEWYAEYIGGTAAAVLGQPEELRRRLDSGRLLADEYRMAEPQAVQLCSEAMLAHIEGRFDDAHRHYAEAAGQMRRNGSMHADGFHGLARLTIELSQGHVAAAEPLARALHELTGPLAADAWAVTLAAAGRAGEARRRYQEAAAMPLRADFFHSIFATVRAMAAIAMGDRTAVEALVTDLTLVAGLLAGAASAALAMQPVAQTLGELSAFLGHPEATARHFATAEQVARRWNSPHWTARARAAASRCPPNG
jgi:DNA-binding SARP family transcriptional activator